MSERRELKKGAPNYVFEPEQVPVSRGTCARMGQTQSNTAKVLKTELIVEPLPREGETELAF